MKRKRQVQSGKLETATVLDRPVDRGTQEQKLVLECINEEGNIPGAYLFENRGSGWVYYGLYPKGTLILDRRSANLRMPNEVYALSLDGHVPETLNVFLSEQSRGRPDSTIVIKITKPDGHYEMEVSDMRVPAGYANRKRTQS